jgi:hypothetical protein
MKEVGKFYGHVIYFTAIRHILWSFGIFCGNLVSFPRFGILLQEKSGNPDQRMLIVSVVPMSSDVFQPFRAEKEQNYTKIDWSCSQTQKSCMPHACVSLSLQSVLFAT